MHYSYPYNSDESTPFCEDPNLYHSVASTITDIYLFLALAPFKIITYLQFIKFQNETLWARLYIFMVLRKSITWVLPIVINGMCGWLIEETYAIILYIIRSGRSIRQWYHDLFLAGKAICIYEQKSSAIMQMPSAWLLWRSLSFVWYFCGINYLEKWQSTWLPWPLLAYSDCATATDRQHRSPA